MLCPKEGCLRSGWREGAVVKVLREKAAGEDCEGFEFELLGPKALWHVELKWGMCAVGVE